MFFSQYVKKEDAREALRSQRIYTAVAFLSMAVFLGVLQYTVSPRLLNLYKDLERPIPLITQWSNFFTLLFSIFSIIISLFLFVTQPNYQKLDIKLKKYKNGEMIRTRNITNLTVIIVFLFILGLIPVLLMITTILPIYQITQTL